MHAGDVRKVWHGSETHQPVPITPALDDGIETGKGTRTVQAPDIVWSLLSDGRCFEGGANPTAARGWAVAGAASQTWSWHWKSCDDSVDDAGEAGSVVGSTGKLARESVARQVQRRPSARRAAQAGAAAELKLLRHLAQAETNGGGYVTVGQREASLTP